MDCYGAIHLCTLCRNVLEACKVVFCAPEVFQHMKAAKSSSTVLRSGLCFG